MASGGVRKGFESLALTLLRISTGVIMAVHGWQKLMDIPQWIGKITEMGFPAPTAMAYLSIAGEFLGGLGLVFGFLTPLAALGVLAVMVVAIYKVHWPHGLLAMNNGFEYPMTLGFVALFFIFRGSGPLGIDALFCRKKPLEESPS